jgi:GH18 family chitinase
MTNYNNWAANQWGVTPPTPTYFIDPLTGNDANAGTSLLAAWKTYAHAEQVVLSPGQSIAKLVGGQFVIFKHAVTTGAKGLVAAYYQGVGGSVSPSGSSAIPLASIDWAALTHIYHDHVEVNADGSLNTDYLGISPTFVGPLISTARANGVKVLAVFGDIAYEQSGTSLVYATTGSGTLTYSFNWFAGDRAKSTDTVTFTVTSVDIYGTSTPQILGTGLTGTATASGPSTTLIGTLTNNTTGTVLATGPWTPGDYPVNYVPDPPATDPINLITQSPSLISTFIGNILDLVILNQYDGVVIDWEMGLTSIGFQALMSALYPALKAANPLLQLSAALGNGNAMMAANLIYPVPLIDQFTCMAYDLYLSAGEVTWFNSPLYGGVDYTRWGLQLPSAQSNVTSFLQLGVPRAQLMLGVPTYGHTYTSPAQFTGVYMPIVPRQLYAQNFLNDGYTPYNRIDTQSGVNGYSGFIPCGPEHDQWDALAQAPYLGIPGTDPTGALNTYVTYDDPAGLTAKCAWATSENLGGIAVWELNLDYFASRSIVSPLINTIKLSYPKTAFPVVTPAQPVDLCAVAVTSIVITLRWSVHTDTTLYIILRSTTSGTGYLEVGRSVVSSFADTTVAAGTQYYYIVVPANMLVQGPQSAQIAVVATAGGGGTVPSAPTALTCTAPALPNASYGTFYTTLNWSGSASKYYVHRSNVYGTHFARIATTSSTTYTDTTLNPDATWYYCVTAVSSAGLESPNSGQVTTSSAVKYTSPNMLGNPNAINLSPWTIPGTGETAPNATTLTASTTGDTFLGQVFAVAPNTVYNVTLIVTPSSGSYFAGLGVYVPDFSASLGTSGGGSSVTAGVPTQLIMQFNSLTNTSVLLWLDCNAPIGSTITVTSASVSVPITEVPPNLLVSPLDITDTLGWTLNPGTALIGDIMQCVAVPDLGHNVGALTQLGVPVTANTYYVATVSAVRTDSTSFPTGGGGYVAFSIQGFVGGVYANGLGGSCQALSPGVVVDQYILFNSGPYTEVVFAIYVTGVEAASSTLALTNLSLAFNPYGGLT